jgi:hypothetical protein
VGCQEAVSPQYSLMVTGVNPLAALAERLP